MTAPVVTFNGVPLFEEQVSTLRRAMLRAGEHGMDTSELGGLLQLLDHVDESVRRLRAEMYFAWCQHEDAKRAFIANGTAANAGRLALSGDMLTLATRRYHAAKEQG